MRKRRLSLGIDTSNYTTSAALTDAGSGEILSDLRVLLSVKQGEKGLRQSDALFQHWQNLPAMLEKLYASLDGELACIAVSEKPRPQEGSYMPVFTAGVNAARMLAASSGTPLLFSTHQEGHIAAAMYGNEAACEGDKLICAHLSGGTLELVLRSRASVGSQSERSAAPVYTYEVIGGTKDISYGQLLDRLGVDWGFAFPAGKSIDDLALSFAPEGRKSPFSRVFCDKTYLNLSGLETQLKSAKNALSKEEAAYWVMDAIAESFVRITEAAKKETGARTVLVTGGVACSAFLRGRCEPYGYAFGRRDLCSDNAVGISLLGGALCH